MTSIRRTAADRNIPPYRAAKSVKNSHTAPCSIRQRLRAREALEFRLQGFTLAQIAGEMKCVESYVRRLLDWAMEETIAEPAADLRKMELERLDLLQTGFMASAVAGDADALKAVLKIMDQRHRLLGLYQHVVQHTREVAGGNQTVILQVMPEDLAC